MQSHCQNENDLYPLERGRIKTLLVWKNMTIWICMLIGRHKKTKQLTQPIGDYKIPIVDILEKVHEELDDAFIRGLKSPNRTNFPNVGFVASPGTGKSYGLQELATDTIALEEWWKKKSSQSNGNYNKDLSQKFYEFMQNALRVVVTFNNNLTAPWPGMDEEHPEIGMCCRILYRFAKLFFIGIFFKKEFKTQTQLLCS